MTSGARLPTWKERENNKKRERRRRAIASKIFSGLRQFGNYKLPKHCDNNEVLKALCAEAGWVVEEDGTTYRKGAKPVERIEVCASAPASPSPTSSYHNTGVATPITNTTTTTSLHELQHHHSQHNQNPSQSQTHQQATNSGASLIPWLKGLSGTSTPTSNFHPNNNTSSAPVTPPLSSPRSGSKTINLNSTGSTILAPPQVQFHHPSNPNMSSSFNKQSDWDRIAMAEHWLDSTTGFGAGAGGWSPVIVGPAISPAVGPGRAASIRPCETPDGCLTPCSDVGDSEPSVTELLTRYSGSKSGRWINGTRVLNSGSTGVVTGFGSFVSSSGTATPTRFVDGNGWMKAGSRAPSPAPILGSSSGYHHLQAQQQQQQQQQVHHQHQPQGFASFQEGNKEQQQCSPCSSSVCGVVLETGKRKRSSRELDPEMNRFEEAPPGGVPGRIDVTDRLQLTLATPASSS